MSPCQVGIMIRGRFHPTIMTHDGFRLMVPQPIFISTLNARRIVRDFIDPGACQS